MQYLFYVIACYERIFSPKTSSVNLNVLQFVWEQKHIFLLHGNMTLQLCVCPYATYYAFVSSQYS
jgi:hypothetical protein